MQNFLKKVMEIKENLERDGVLQAIKEMERKIRPSKKTVFTLIWIILSAMIGEIIIYNHQNIFSSYSISASDIRSSSSQNEYAPASGGREQYENQHNSTENFYKKILTRYTAESETKSAARELNKTAGFKNQSRAAAALPASQKIENDRPRLIIHKVKNGESLTGISKSYYKTTSKYKDIAVTNNIPAPYSIKSGDRLIIMLK
jgi:hypothetical protein